MMMPLPGNKINYVTSITFVLSRLNYTSFTTIKILQSVGECTMITTSTELGQVPSYSGLVPVFPTIYMHHEHPLVGYILLPFATHFIHDS